MSWSKTGFDGFDDIIDVSSRDSRGRGQQCPLSYQNAPPSLGGHSLIETVRQGNAGHDLLDLMMGGGEKTYLILSVSFWGFSRDATVGR